MHQKSELKSLTKEELQLWLQWGSLTLFALRGRRIGPAALKAQGLDYLEDINTAYGYTEIKTKVPIPNKEEITLMDEIIFLPNVISDIAIRRIVHLSSLISPKNQSRIYSTRRLAKKFHTNDALIRNLYDKGLSEIIAKTAEQKICYIRNFSLIHDILPCNSLLPSSGSLR